MTKYITYEMRGICRKRVYKRIDEIRVRYNDIINGAIQERREAWNKCGISINYKMQTKSLTQIRADDPVYEAISAPVMRGALKRVEKSFQGFFRRVKRGEKPGYPRFSPIQRMTTLEADQIEPANFKRFDNGQIAVKFKGLPRIRGKPRRPLPETGLPKAVRIIRQPFHIDLQLVFEHDPEALPPTGKAIGVDMGVRRRMTMSDGYSCPSYSSADRKAVRRAQRAISRSQKKSKGRVKRVKQLVVLRRKERVRRKNACHRETSSLIKKHDVIVTEDLKIRNMMGSAKGTKENPGKQVSQKRGLNRKIAEQGWGLIHQQLTYKENGPVVKLSVLIPAIRRKRVIRADTCR